MSTQEILKQCSVDGKSLRLPQITLDRKEFTEQIYSIYFRIEQ